MDACPICKESIGNGIKAVTLQAAGAHTVNDASLSRGLNINVVSGTVVHERCRRDFTNKKEIERTKRKRESESECVAADSPVKRRSQCSSFSCDERKDRWAAIVLPGRIAAAGNDLNAADAVYHQVCNVNFRTGKQPPAKFDVKQNKPEIRVGRPKDVGTESAFIAVVNNFINEEDEQKTITDLCKEMEELCQTPYSTVYMKKRLLEFLGDRVTISNAQGKANVVTFNETAALILQTYHENSKTSCDLEGEKDRIIRTAVALIKSEIIDKYKSFSKEFYPDPNDLKSVDVMLDFLPDSLKLFLDELLVGKSKGLKMATIGQCLVQVARPRAVVAPLQLGLAVELHHKFGSKFLINTLHDHGLCSSYAEVLNFESCAAAQTPITADIDTDSDSPVQVMLGDGHFRQYVCDNADKNPWTLDGKTSLHAR